jgi:outer membrane receptor protein involved in Fe transport
MIMNRHKLYLFQILLLFLIFSIAEAGSIRGGINDERGRPLSGVNITVADRNIGTTSNEFGLFFIDNLQIGVYTIVFNYMGYKYTEIDVDLDSDQIKIQNIVLVEEILTMDPFLVTAQKRIEQIKDVPVTMSIVNAQFLNLDSQVNLDVLSGYVPGLNVFSYSNNRPNYVIRGLTSDAFLASAQPRVSVYYNNIPISRNTGALIELYDMDRIEILKGPQGTLFGRGAQIGAVHLISKKPVNYLQGEFSAETGNYGHNIFNGMLNVPFSNNFYSRFAASYIQRNGFVTNTDGGQLNERKTAAFRSSFRYIPGEKTIIDLMFDYQEDQPGGTAFMSKIYPNRLGQIDVFGETASFERGSDLGINRKIINLNLNVHHYFTDNLDLNNFLSYREHSADEIWDGDGSAGPALDFEEDVDVRQIVLESRLNFDLGHRFNGFAGISYWQEKIDQSVRFSPNEQSLFFLFFDPQGLVDGQGNPNFVPALPPLPELGELGGLPLPTEHVEESFQQAGSEALETFLDGTFKLSKKFHLTAGLRLIMDRISLDASNRFIAGDPSTLGLLTGNYPNVLFATGEVSDKSEYYTSVVGRFLGRYSFTENLSTYAGYARGRRPNVIQLRADAKAETLDDEKVDNYEIGFKGVLSDRLFFDAAAYYYDYNDFQTRAFVADQESGEYQLIVKDGGKAHAYGFESGLRYTVNQDIQFHATYAYIHARFDETDSNGDEQEYAGNKFRLTPDHTWSIFANFGHTFLNSFKVYILPSYTYKSHFFFEDDNTEGLEQDAYGLFNLQGGIYYLPYHLELSLFAYNILNKDYLVSAGNSGNIFGIPTFVPGAPQTYGVRLKWDF